MTPQPSSSSDGSGLPPRHRPNLGDLSKDTTEMDLWAFDDLDPLEDGTPAPKAAEALVPVPRNMDAKRAKPKESRPQEDGETLEPPVAKVGPAKESIRVNVSKSRPKPISQGTGHSQAGSDFDDLDSWEDSEPATPKPLEPLPVVTNPEDVKPLEVKPLGVKPLEIPSSVEPEARTPEEPDTASAVAEKKVVSPSIPRPNLNLTSIERLGLVVLLVLLLAGGGAAYYLTISRLPKGDNLVRSNDFPITGKQITIQSAESFWRAPVTDGPNADTFRRGTQLLPVLDLAIEGGPASLRIFFRDGRGELIGDAVNRQVNAAGKLEAAATAGLDDMGMYAAYRTGLEKPWTVEVFEIVPGDSQAKPAKLFEMQISTESR